MRIEFDIPDERLQSFTENAKSRLIEQTKSYSIEIIGESERVEGLIRENGASHEITENTVIQAVRTNRTRTRGKTWIATIRVLAEIFLFVAGIMFLPEKFINQDGTLNIGYFIAFILIMLLAVVGIIITNFMGGE